MQSVAAVLYGASMGTFFFFFDDITESCTKATLDLKGGLACCNQLTATAEVKLLNAVSLQFKATTFAWQALGVWQEPGEAQGRCDLLFVPSCP